jgi:hypothetical protein
MSNINELLEKSIYIHEKNEYGHLVIILKDLIGIKSNKQNVELFISKIIKEVENSLEISKRNGKKRGYVHVYFNDCSVTNAPISLFKKINKVLTSKFEDTVEEIFIYSNSNLISKLWGMIKFIVDSDTRDKIRIVKN